MTRPHVAVVGGGFAGLAAAVRLARDGARVTVLERRPFLGGRAYSFTHPATGEVLDNGPHALMGAYTEALDFLAEVGAGSSLLVQPRLHVGMAHPRLGYGAIAAPAVPGPLQAPLALLRYRLLGARDRLGLVVGALRLVARADALAGRTVAEALAAVGQSPAACARFWHPLAIATLNEAPERAAARPFAAVVRRGFLAGARAARFVLSRVPLGELYPPGARRLVEAAGGRIETRAAVETVETDGTRATAAVGRDGLRVVADAFVLAVPVPALLRLLPPALRAVPPFGALAALDTSPIVSTHLWLDRPVAWGSPFLGLLESRAQWLFAGGPTADGGSRIASVTSGARCWAETPDDAIAAEVLAEAAAAVAAFRGARCRRAHVVRERHATLSLTPAAEAARPGSATPLANVFVAGDWIQTGLPATIEGAVQSGRQAATAALGAARYAVADGSRGPSAVHPRGSTSRRHARSASSQPW
jgi:squalene-associated FAD-dependent desaturase